jgi:hypothetical protein
MGNNNAETLIATGWKLGVTSEPLHYLALIEMKPNALDQAAALQDWALPHVFQHLCARTRLASSSYSRSYRGHRNHCSVNNGKLEKNGIWSGLRPNTQRQGWGIRNVRF